MNISLLQVVVIYILGRLEQICMIGLLEAIMLLINPLKKNYHRKIKDVYTNVCTLLVQLLVQIDIVLC